MARSFANISTAIWRPGHVFGTLTWQAQWAHFMLSTQPDISAAGTLSLNVRRWSKRARNCTREDVIAALQELQEAGEVFYDYDTEEVLLRTFVEDDKGYGNSKRQPVIERAALDLESPKLRAILATELRKLNSTAMTKLADRLCAPYGIGYAADRPGNAPSGSEPANEASEAPPSDLDNTAFPQVDSLSDRASDSPCHFDGVVVTQEGVSTTTHNPQSVPPSAGAGEPPAGEPPERKPTRRRKPADTDETTEPNAQAVVAAFIDGARERNRTVTTDVIKQVGATAKRLLGDKNITPDKLVNAAREMGRRGWKDLNMQLLRGPGTSNSNGSNSHNPYLDPVDQSLYERPL